MTDPESGPWGRRFNARRSSPAEVAKSFVAPEVYRLLTDSIEPQILIGPRGIGKTTLLKMLLPEAVNAWLTVENLTPAQVAERDRAQKAIGFTGVFVAADKMWSGQVSAELPLIAQQHRQQFGNAAFTYMALGALAESANYRVGAGADGWRGVPISVPAQEEVARSVVKTWHAHPATATFSGLLDQMEERLGEVGELIRKASKPDLQENELREITRDPVLDVEFATATRRFVHAFNRAASEPHAPWILLVDEFEFLPPWTRLLLGDALTGHDPLLSFKLSIAPYTGTSPFDGTSLNDWSKVRLTQPSREQGDAFTRQLLTREIERRGGKLSPEEVFGPGGFEAAENGYEPDGQNAEDIRKLADIDQGFATWLREKVGESGTSALRDPRRYDPIRKAMQLVRLRLEFFRVRASTPRRKRSRTLRSRHIVPPIYAGLENLYAFAEDNPRWLLALSNAVLENYRGGRARVSRAKQARAIAAVSWELYNNLSSVAIEPRAGTPNENPSVPVAAPNGPYERLTPFTLIESLGEFLSEKTHAREFSPDVPGMFFVDTDDGWVANLINSLVFLGALIIEPSPAGDQREVVRPAHMWAPIFKLLPRKGKRRSLKRALRATTMIWKGEPPQPPPSRRPPAGQGKPRGAARQSEDQPKLWSDS